MPETRVTHRETTDLIVLGSGAAGLTAAFTAAQHGLAVDLFEKAAELGGTTAWSGGHVWIPCHPYQGDIGVKDSEEEAFTYIMSLSRGLLDEALIRAYVRSGPRMVAYLDQHGSTSFVPVPDFPDYHPEHPGGKTGGGRTIECPPFSFLGLGEWADRVTPSPYLPNPHLTMSETPLGAVDPVFPDDAELERRRALNIRGAGQGLAGRLLKSCLDVGVTPHLDHRARELLIEDGRVVGVRADTPDGPIEQRARRGVVLACGGFEWNEDYVRAFTRGPLTHPVSMPTCTGDGLYMAMKAGAMLANMREAWWMPAADLPPGVNSMNRAMMNSERTRPRSIMVNRKGRRFTNESANYNAFGAAFHVEDVNAFEYANLPSWILFDQEYLRRYGTIAGFPPGDSPPAWLKGYPSLVTLAEDLGIDAISLGDTVEQWNKNVTAGSDPEYHRGESAHDQWWGDAEHKRTPQAALGPIDTAPYYAIRVASGALGTKGGPRIDADARVVDLDGQAIDGLYAAGNVSGSPFGGTYGGAGGTLGPAMVFGYLAGLHAAGSTCTPSGR